MGRIMSVKPYGLVSILLFLIMSSTAHSKELFGRIGLGYNAQFAQTSATNGAPGISIKYGLNPRTMIEAIAGYYSGTGGTGVAALKFMQTLHSESYINFYFLVGGGLVSANLKSGVEVLGGFGTEFFIPGVDSVGISFEGGLDLENISQTNGSMVLKTFGASFLNAGMHFYL
jgi:hypothetical protein